MLGSDARGGDYVAHACTLRRMEIRHVTAQEISWKYHIGVRTRYPNIKSKLILSLGLHGIKLGTLRRAQLRTHTETNRRNPLRVWVTRLECRLIMRVRLYRSRNDRQAGNWHLSSAATSQQIV